jgi:hypothetical protein
MDLTQTIRRLIQERDNLDRMIRDLQALQLREAAAAAMPPKTLKRRGRKSMGPNEREEVSRRMKLYWSKRRRAAEKSDK